MKDILAKTPKLVDSVTIEPGGQWHLADGKVRQEAPSGGWHVSPLDEDDEALVISDDVSFWSDRKPDTPSQSIQGGTVAQFTSREASTNPRTSTKRPHTEVIDLTLSDEDDDEPPVRLPPEKRQNTGVLNQYYMANGASWPA